MRCFRRNPRLDAPQHLVHVAKPVASLCFSLYLSAPGQDTPLAIGSNDMLNAVASQLLPYLMSGECHMFDLRWIAVLAFALAGRSLSVDPRLAFLASSSNEKRE